MEGTIEAGGMSDINFYFEYNQNYRLKHEHPSGIILRVYEHTEKKQTNEYSVPVDIFNVFSKYLINPPNSINFGAMQFGTKKSRTIEIRNDGHFEFLYDIRKSDSGLPEQFTAALQQMLERDAVKIEAKVDDKAKKAAPPKKDDKKGKGGGAVSADG